MSDKFDDKKPHEDVLLPLKEVKEETQNEKLNKKLKNQSKLEQQEKEFLNKVKKHQKELKKKQKKIKKKIDKTILNLDSDDSEKIKESDSEISLDQSKNDETKNINSKIDDKIIKENKKHKTEVTKKTSNKNKKVKNFFLEKFIILNLSLFFNLSIFIFLIITSTLLIPPPVNNSGNSFSVSYFDEDGVFLGKRGTNLRKEIEIEELTPLIIASIILIEDRAFYLHEGVNPIAMVRALIANVTQGRVAEGGSTITQQLMRTLYLSHDKTIKRKLNEIRLSLWYDGHYSKNIIIKNYLNNIYFGNGSTGIKEAAFNYFNKDIKDLSIKEIAYLAALPKAPSIYSKDVEKAIPRINYIISNLYKFKYISKNDYDLALAEKLNIIEQNNQSYDHFNEFGYAVDFAHLEFKKIIDTFPDNIKGQNFKVITTIDSSMLSIANQEINSVMFNLDPKLNATQAAMMTMDHKGAIKVMIGGLSYEYSQFNRITQAKRQPGSAFKPIVYAAAFENGYKIDSRLNDHAFKIKNWVPRNYDGRYRGSVTITKAFEDSINTIAVLLQEKIGRENIIKLAKRLGIKSELLPHPSLALGSEEVSVFELSDVYLSIANIGIETNPYIISSILTEDNIDLYNHKQIEGADILSKKAAHEINYLMRRSVLRGTSNNAAIKNHSIAGKTGTTSDWRDAWFIGFSGYYLTSVWVGNDNYYRMNKVTGGYVPANIFHNIMTKYHEGLSPRPLLGDTNPSSLYLDNWVIDRNIYSTDNIYESIINELLEETY